MKFFNFAIFQFFNKRRAFTLIEFIITTTILILLVGTTLLIILNYKNSAGINSTSQEIVSILRNAQNRSLSQESGVRWGVHFENPTGATGFYELFKGAAYSPVNVAEHASLPVGTRFSMPGSGSSSTVIFAPVNGLPDNAITIMISLITQPSVSSTIIIRPNGQIVY